MPLKTKLTPALDSNILAIQPQNALGFNVDETAKSTPAESELFLSQILVAYTTGCTDWAR